MECTPFYFGCNIHNTGESCEGDSYRRLFCLTTFLKFPLAFSLKVGNIFSVVIQKVHWIESKRNWEKPLINTAWPPTSQTCAYQHDLETNPDTTLTCLRVEYRKRNWEKPLISTQKCVYRTRVPCKRSKERPRPFSESESGKNS